MAEAYLARSFGFQRTLAELSKAERKGPLYEFLKDFASVDRCYTKFDFLEYPDITYYPFLLNNSAGTSSADFSLHATARNGAIEGDTGTTDNGSISLVGGFRYRGDDNPGLLVRARLDVVTSVNWEIGWIDAVPGSNGPGVSDVDTPATTAADCALFTIDTDQTNTGLNFVTNGSTAGQDAVATAVPTPALAADTYCFFIVQIVGNHAYALFGDETTEPRLVASHDRDPDGAIEGNTGIAPWIYCRTRNTTAKFPRIDLIELWCDRAA